MGCKCSLEQENRNGLLDKLQRAKITKAYNFDKMNLTSLKYLDTLESKDLDINVFSARENKLNNLPINFFKNIRKILKLDLSNNCFLRPDEIIFEKSTLTNLNFSNNLLERVPKAIGYLVNLKELNLSFNQISLIGKHEELLGLASLEVLNLSNNKFIEFPVVFLSLNKLEVLNLSHNSIVELPDKEWDGSNVINLEMSFNKLNRLTNGLLKSSNVSILNLRGNYLKKEDLIKADWYELFEKRRKDRIDKGYEKNLIVNFDLCGLD
jgi:Leucine-rich repeat (LRR) protein